MYLRLLNDQCDLLIDPFFRYWTHNLLPQLLFHRLLFAILHLQITIMNPKKHLLHYNTKALITLRKILMIGIYSMMYLFSQGQDTRTRPAVSQQRLGRTITTAAVKQNAVENINARIINTSSSTLKKEFATLNQGEYSLISLKLPGSTSIAYKSVFANSSIGYASHTTVTC